MSRIAQAVIRKKQQLPQYEYLWRVDMPSLGSTGGDQSFDFGGLASSSLPVRQLGEQPPNNLPVRQLGEQAASILGSFQQTSQITGTDADEISHRVVSIDAPMPSYESKKNTAGASFVYTASNNDIGNISFKIDEMEDGLTLEYLTKWQSMISNDDGSYNPPAFYKRDIKIIRMTSTELDIHVTTYHGYFPTEISPIGYSYEGNGIMQYNVTLTGDSVSHQIVPAGQVRQIVDAEQSAIMNATAPTGYDIGGLQNVIGAAGMIINDRNFGKIINTVNKVIKFF